MVLSAPDVDGGFADWKVLSSAHRRLGRQTEVFEVHNSSISIGRFLASGIFGSCDDPLAKFQCPWGTPAAVP